MQHLARKKVKAASNTTSPQRYEYSERQQEKCILNSKSVSAGELNQRGAV